jgi:uncharacterized glyoxalase superfamily protein PhnB
MIRVEPIIGVEDVARSSSWYQQLFSFESQHGGDTFEMLAETDGTIVLCLHKWGKHDHPTLTDPTMAGNGLILYFRVDDLDQIWKKAQQLQATIELELHINPNSGEREFALRDPDGYYLLISL